MLWIPTRGPSSVESEEGKGTTFFIALPLKSGRDKEKGNTIGVLSILKVHRFLSSS